MQMTDGGTRPHPSPLPVALSDRIPSAYKFHSDKESDWQAVYNIAKLSKDRYEFLEMLKAEGWLVK